MCREIFGPLLRDAATNTAVMETMWGYVQVRHLYAQGRFWDPHVAPPVASQGGSFPLTLAQA
jgi:hypothetical protein